MDTKTERSAADFLPATRSWSALREAASHCQGCDLYQRATQTVFGRGAHPAPIMLVGEMPGDQEDKEGIPFVGPAGRLLAKALDEAGVDEEATYITNVVKHFKWEPHGKRRQPKKPGWREVAACQPWLEAEIALVQPKLLICLGATAAQTLLGRAFRITRQRGEIIASRWAEATLATYHPSAVLRAPEPADRERLYGLLVADLHLAVQQLAHR